MRLFSRVTLLWLFLIVVAVDTRGAKPQIYFNGIMVAEGNSGYTDFVFTATLSEPSLTAVTADFATESDSAIAPRDYLSTSGTITFDPGETVQTFTVRVVGDALMEDNEKFWVRIFNVVGAAEPLTLPGAYIVNDDGLPLVSIADVHQAEGDTGTTEFVFTVKLSGPKSGWVAVDIWTRDGSAVAGRDYRKTAVKVKFAPGVTVRTFSVPVFGDTSYSYLPQTFTVHSQVYRAVGQPTAVGVIEDDDPVPAFAITDVAHAEGDAGTTDFLFDVTLSGVASHPVSVWVETVNGTAVAPDDYTAVSKRVHFAPGETKHTVTVRVAGDAGLEPTETFFVHLRDPVNGPTLGDAEGVGTIVNDDHDPPSVTIEDVIEIEANEDMSFAFTVTLSGPSFKPVTVDYRTADDTAGDDDYTATAGTLEFDPGVTLRTINVPVLGDTLYEHDERFFVKLTNASGATLANSVGEGWIQNDDALPALSIDDVSQPAATSFAFDVSLSAPSGIRTTVDFATSDGTATAPGDYTAASGTLIFEPGEMLRTIAVAVAGDRVVEPAETFFVTLSNPHGATLADEQGIGTITADAPVFADLAVANVSPAWAYAGATIHYLITVTNAGPEAATNVMVTDTLPAGATLLSATPSQGTCSGTTTVTCTLGTIDNGSSASIDLMVTAPPVCGEMWNTAAAQSDQIDPTVAAGTASMVVVGRARRRG